MYRELAFQIWSKFSLYCFCCCLREMFGDSWTKILQYLRCQIEVTYICSIGIFSDMEALELQVVSVSSNEFLSYFDFASTLFLFVKLFRFYLLWTSQVSQNVWNTFSLSFGWMMNVTLFIHLWATTHFLWFFSELSRLFLCGCRTNFQLLLLKSTLLFVSF